MRDLTFASPILLCLVVVVAGAMASLIPVSPIEPLLVGVAMVAPPWLLLPIVLLATASHMSTKMLVFLGGAKVQAAFKGRTRDRFDQARIHLAGHPRLQHGTLFISSVTGLPPFYLITALCGTLRMPMREFVVLATTGRAIRFAALVFAPQLFRPAVAGAQTVPPAVRAVGTGPRTCVMLSGMVGGVAGFARMESRLAAAGHRVISIDPYQLAIDSTDVSFDAMARLANANEPEAVAEVVARIQVPVIVLLGGSRTKAGPHESELIPLRQLRGLRATGHFPHEESPDAVVALLARRPVLTVANREEHR